MGKSFEREAQDGVWGHKLGVKYLNTKIIRTQEMWKKLWESVRRSGWEGCGVGCSVVEKICSGCSVWWESVRVGGENGGGCENVARKINARFKRRGVRIS